jgi:VWFA-related protein
MRIFPGRAAVLALLLFVAGGMTTGAQSGGRERTLFLSAVDRAGAPIENLTVDDVVVREDGVRREVLRMSRAIDPIDIVLLADNSAASTDLLQPMREGLTKFVTAMTNADGPRHNIALIGLAARPTMLVDYTSNRQQLEAGIGRLFTESTSGMTLLDAIVEVSRGIERREGTRAVIVPVITDGAEFSNRYYREVVEALTRAGASLHAITIGTFPISQDDAIRNRAIVLDDGPRATGGQRATLLSAQGVPAAMEKLARELSSQYKVVYGRPESLVPPEKTDVSTPRAGVTVRATPARGQNRGV